MNNPLNKLDKLKKLSRLKKLNNLNRYLLLGVAAVALQWTPVQSWALTAANTLIKNQASASFKDESGQSYHVTSNMVETLVQQVAGLTLDQTQTKRGSIDGTVEFPHVLTNTGNGDDTYDLIAAETSGDHYDFSSVTFYADLNQDGQPDNLSSPITRTPLLAAGEHFAFIAIAKVPNTVSAGNSGTFDLTASSEHVSVMGSPAPTASNSDTVTITSQAIVDVTKSISATAGASPSGAYTVTLRYDNKSSVAANDVTLLDALPSGMTYVANSGRWSESGATVLTDSNPADLHSATGINLRYCAYDASCIGLVEATQDADSDSSNQVTAIISEVPAGARGTLTFSVNIASGLSASILKNVGEFEYNDGSSSIPLANTNPVYFKITQKSGVVTNGSSTLSTDGTLEPITVASISQGGTAVFTDYVWNTGNGVDSFDLSLTGSTFPAGTSLQLFKADGVTPLLDTNGNGIPDTGDMNPAAVTSIVIRAQLPPSLTGTGLNYQVSLKATSFVNNTLSNPAINRLQSIVASSVDLTNNSAYVDANTPGAGIGPESAAVTTNIAAPGTTTRFTLFINNTSNKSDNFDLAASTDSSFATKVLPTGWSVQFTDDNQNIFTNSGNLAAGASKKVYADVTLPADETAATTALYFQVYSPVTQARDIKYDAVTVGAVTDLILEPNNQSQVLPGGVVVYSHWLTNQGNITQSNISLTQTNTAGANGWTSQLFEDTNNDGVFNAGDQAINTVASLPSGDSKLLFVKVYAPASIPLGSDNLTTITASWNAGADSTQAEDLTTTNRSDVQITKEQAPDRDCNGQVDAGYAFSRDFFAVEPGKCILYQLVATNTGVEMMQNVRIQDATPAYTVFRVVSGVSPLLSQGSLATSVTNGSQGDITGAMGSLAPGDTASLVFGIKIE